MNFVPIKGHALCQRELIATKGKYIDNIFSRTTGPISTKLGTEHHWVKGIQFLSIEGPCPFSKRSNTNRLKIY